MSTQLEESKPLPTSHPDPYKRLKTAYWATFFLGGTNIVLGVGFLSIPTYRTSMIFTIILGAVLLILGFLIMRKSLIALIIAIAIQLIGNTIPNLLNIHIILSGGFTPILGFIVRLIFLFQMVGGISAIITIRNESKKKVRSLTPSVATLQSNGEKNKLATSTSGKVRPTQATKQAPKQNHPSTIMSALMVCPKCKIKVLPKTDGTCPNCQSKIVSNTST